jgi:hypothetical protein
VGDRLPPLSAAASGAGNGRDASVEEEVVESDLLGPQLHQQRAFPLAEPLHWTRWLTFATGDCCLSSARRGGSKVACRMQLLLWPSPPSS